jgi:hypothetical protein
MRVIFLDVDGVLNSVRSMIALHDEYKASWAASDKETVKNKLLRNHVDPIAVKLFNRITDHNPDVAYVISSSHRKLYKLKHLEEHIRGLGITGPVLGSTGSDPRGFRGNEIRNWLVHNNSDKHITHYVIVDDSDDMTDAQKSHHFVRTSNDDGMSYANYKEILKINTDPS